MLDPLISLAFSVHSNRGAYALLLGSGVSRAASIPTGWEVVLDLTEKVAHLRGEETQSDPAGWYRTQFGGDPDYAVLLAELAAQPAERQRLLRSYFEPTEAERDLGLKVPTVGHHAIAGLVSNGHIRAIVTTNFDRLLERALEARGIVPTVIATPDAVAGALPLAHTDCTVVKVHGDYLDARLRNTPDELAQYDERVDRLLDRIFDEYGLIVCGWSAEWDTALRDALSRCASHRFTTFWATRGEPSETAAALLELRRAVLVPIADADSFFVEFEEKVNALERLAAPHPLSAALAAETVKRYLADGRHRIRLFDLVNDELSRVEREASDEAFPRGGDIPTTELIIDRLERYEGICGPLEAMMAVGCFWGEEAHRQLWVRVLDRLANRSTEHSGLETWLNLRGYPVALVLYTGGIAAIAAGHYENLAALLGGARVRKFGEDKPLITEHHIVHVVDERFLQTDPRQRFYTPASDRLVDVLREPLRDFLPNEEQYLDAFDKFEYLLSLAYAHYLERDGRMWAPAGRFWWRQRRRDRQAFFDRVESEATAAGEGEGILSGQLFDGSLERFRVVRDAYQRELLAQVHWM